MAPKSNRDAAGRLARPGRVFVLSGPSGVGKNTIADRLRARGLAVRAVTATTRAAKPGEQHGRDYLFVSEEEFGRWLREGRLAESTCYVGHRYGTPLASVEAAGASGRPVVLTIDVDGGLQLKRRFPAVTLIFVEPPSEAELRRRLRTRGRDDAETIERRIRRALEECALAADYDFRVVNDDLDTAVETVAEILTQRAGHDETRS
ncbi:MAG: guanylate kinase [Candidatus Brocadiaceae bacterium]|nr:guanylate kinase [Candidatus Brocadiaceae bacterium]